MTVPGAGTFGVSIRAGGTVVFPAFWGRSRAGVVPVLSFMAVHHAGGRARSAVLVPAFTRARAGVCSFGVLVPARSFKFGALTHARARTRSACVHCAGVLTVYPWGGRSKFNGSRDGAGTLTHVGGCSFGVRVHGVPALSCRGIRHSHGLQVERARAVPVIPRRGAFVLFQLRACGTLMVHPWGWFQFGATCPRGAFVLTAFERLTVGV